MAESTALSDRWLGSLKWILAMAVVYYAADRAMLLTAFYDGWTICWPLNGVTIALLLMRPRRDWPAIMLGVALGTGLAESVYVHNHLSAVLQRAFSVLEVVLSALVLPRFFNLDQWLREPHIYRRFCIALVLGPGVSGLLAALWFHYLNHQPFWSAFNDWATADSLGIAIIMPLALSLRSEEMRRLFGRSKRVETAALFVLTGSLSWLLFNDVSFGLFFVVFPALLLVDSLLGFAGAAVAMPMVCVIAIYGEQMKHGPFAQAHALLPISNDVALQVFLGFQALALFPASILFRQREQLQTALRETNLQLEALASLDGLTVISNRRTFDERFAMEWQRAGRQKGSLALLMVDIDHFKQFNDRYGHLAGDICLKSVAQELQRQVSRTTDMVARFGGEEFTVLLPDTSAEGATLVARKLCEAIRALEIPHEASGLGYVTVSIGCACRVPDERINGKDLMQMADEALYAAKRNGRNRFQVNVVDGPEAELNTL